MAKKMPKVKPSLADQGVAKGDLPVLENLTEIEKILWAGMPQKMHPVLGNLNKLVIQLLAAEKPYLRVDIAAGKPTDADVANPALKRLWAKVQDQVSRVLADRDNQINEKEVLRCENVELKTSMAEPTIAPDVIPSPDVLYLQERIKGQAEIIKNLRWCFVTLVKHGVVTKLPEFVSDGSYPAPTEK